jgi:hypothetical protein
MRQKTWVYSPPKLKVPDAVRVEIDTKATELVNTFLKREHVKSPPKKARLNYLVEIYAKWHRNYFYFCSKYACPGRNAISPFFDTGFARLEYVGNVGSQNPLNMSSMRHTGKWWEIGHGLFLDQCLAEIREGGLSHP